jgi:hypothetical protein
MFLEQLRRNTRVDAARNVVNSFVNNRSALKIYIWEALKSGMHEEITDFLIEKARELYRIAPGRESLTLLVVCMLRARRWKESMGLMQRLCVMEPSFCRFGRELMMTMKQSYVL